MQLDPEVCYRAMVARDRRFEGRFVVAVRSTGIYCRPGCPAKLPHKRNVRFYAHPAAAEEAGYRPCLRCRPEASPGTPAWLGTSATVARALRLIVDGRLDGDGRALGVDALAGRLGIGARHLTRLFAEHVGVAPGAVARTRRIHFARKLVDETELPMAEVALAAGFASVRRFNEAMRETFRRAPTALRRASAEKGRGSLLRLKLPYRAPLDWPAFRAFLGARVVPGVERFDGDVWRRAVSVEGWTGVIAVRPLEGQAALELTLDGAPPRALLPVVDRTTRLFDLDADPRAIAAHLERDPILRPLLRARPGLRVPGAWDGFELAVRAILGQQVTVAHATALAGRLVAACGTPLDDAAEGAAPDGLTHLFPTAAQVARVDVAALGMPRARARAISQLAAAVERGQVELTPGRDLDATVAALAALPGIGPWTAQYIALRALGEPDAFPASDLGIRTVLARRGLSTASEIERRAARWSPWRAYAAMQLWMSP